MTIKVGGSSGGGYVSPKNLTLHNIELDRPNSMVLSTLNGGSGLTTMVNINTPSMISTLITSCNNQNSGSTLSRLIVTINGIVEFDGSNIVRGGDTSELLLGAFIPNPSYSADRGTFSGGIPFKVDSLLIQASTAGSPYHNIVIVSYITEIQ